MSLCLGAQSYDLGLYTFHLYTPHYNCLPASQENAYFVGYYVDTRDGIAFAVVIGPGPNRLLQRHQVPDTWIVEVASVPY